MEVRQGSAVGGVRGQGLKTLVIEQTAMKIIRARLRNDIHHAASGSPKFRISPAGNDLELLHCFERDVDRSALPSQLLAEEAVVIVAAIEADVIEDAALAVDIDLVAIWPLHNADTRGHGQQVFKLSAKHWSRRNRLLSQRCR